MTVPPDMPFLYSFDHGDVKKYEEVDCSFLDLYEHHIWMAQQNGGEFYKLVGYGYNRFLPDDYKNVVKNAERVYRERPGYWHAGVDFFITKPLFRSELVDLFEKINDFSEAVYEPEAAKGEVQFAGERILLVEDNELNLEVAASLLEMKGLTIESACNGLQALEKFCSTPVGYYDAVLMDIRMPVMDGLEAARNIRLFDKSDAQTIPIIAMTANAFDEDVEKSHAAGMNAHLAKPIDPEKLFAVLQEFI